MNKTLTNRKNLVSKTPILGLFTVLLVLLFGCNVYAAEIPEGYEGYGPALYIDHPELFEDATSSNAVPVEEEQQIQQPTNRWGVTLTADEFEIFARIMQLECGGESDLGQQAVAEVILNRVYNQRYPNDVVGVLSQVDCGYRQFSTWRNVNSRKAAPSDRIRANLTAVLNGQTNILPYETVYFSRGAQNKRVQARIGRHIFCNQ